MTVVDRDCRAFLVDPEGVSILVLVDDGRRPLWSGGVSQSGQSFNPCSCG